MSHSKSPKRRPKNPKRSLSPKSSKKILIAFTNNKARTFIREEKKFRLEKMITNLDLSDLNLNHLPSWIFSFSQLKELDLSTNQFISIPSEIVQLAQLKRLYLHNNQLSFIPPEIGNLTQLDELYLQNNQLTFIPLEIGNLTQLKWLYLQNNQLTFIPPEIGNLTQLEWLYLQNNQLTGIPHELEHLSKLKILNISENPLKEIPYNLKSKIIIDIPREEIKRLQNIDESRGKRIQLKLKYGMKNIYHMENKDELGYGTSGTAYHVFAEVDGKKKDFTLKEFENKEFFTGELKKIKSLFERTTNKSPYVNEIIDYGEDFIVYNYYLTDVDNFFEKTKSIRIFIHLMHDILLGLQWIHNRGFAHNDLKPRNFLYDDKKNIFVITDFDTICSKKIPCQFITTTAFASPDTLFNWGSEGTLEQMQKADLWSIGASFFNLFFITKNPRGRINYFPYPEDVYDEINDLPDVYNKPIPQNRIEKIISNGSQEEDIIAYVINGFLRVNPEERISIYEALEPIYNYNIKSMEKNVFGI